MSETNFTDEVLNVITHNDADRHWIGESLARASDAEISATGVTTTAGSSNFVAPADHQHQVDTGILTEFAEFNPAGNIDATTGVPLVLWLSAPISGEVPSWATRAIVQVNLTGIYVVTAAPTTYLLDVTLSGGGIAGQVEYIAFQAVNERRNISFVVSDTSGFNTGPGQFIRVFAGNPVGGGVLRADVNSRLSCLITFRP